MDKGKKGTIIIIGLLILSAVSGYISSVVPMSGLGFVAFMACSLSGVLSVVMTVTVVSNWYLGE